jgi:hypothetical protein
MAEACGDCRFFDVPYRDGRCRRFPKPESVSRVHWCGEWVSRAAHETVRETERLREEINRNKREIEAEFYARRFHDHG